MCLCWVYGQGHRLNRGSAPTGICGVRLRSVLGNRIGGEVIAPEAARAIPCPPREEDPA